MGILAVCRPVRALDSWAVLVPGYSTLALSAVLAGTLGTGCAEQDPAFTEDRSAYRRQSDDAIARGAGQDGGVEALDPSALPDGGEFAQGPDGAGDGGGTAADESGGDGLADEAADGTDVTDGMDGTDGDGSMVGSGDGSGDAADNGSGGGTPMTSRTIELTQKGPGKIDILWVVDTSGSMSEEQQYLATNFNAMITALNGAGHDFQTAVTTTDVCDDVLPDDLALRSCPASYGGDASTHLRGSFRGDVGRKVLKRGDADLISRFNAYTRAGVNGSGFEHGLKGAQLAVAKVMSGENEPLIRAGAFLAVIVVSDEEDDGIGLSMTDAYSGYNYHQMGLTTFRYTENDMISYLQGVKGAGNFAISAITPTRLPDGALCSAPHSQPSEEGTQYIKAAAKSGGITQSICDTNWSQSLATLGLDLNAQITQVALPSKPDPQTIAVKIDGVATDEWTYNAGNNAVKFNSGHVPAEGARITVRYYESP